MESGLKRLCMFVKEVVALEEVVSKSRLSHSEVKVLLEMVDVKQKGYLDLGDVLDLVGKIS